MALTQKYKQQQQQVRVLTNESNYLKGMYFSEIPLAEGFSRVLINYDIDSMSGKITPRKGLQSVGMVYPTTEACTDLHNNEGFNLVVNSKVCAESDAIDPRKINRHLQTILYNTERQDLLVATCDPDVSENNQFKISPFVIRSSAEYITPEPFVIAHPGIHNKNCIHNNFFKRPVGAFAFGNSYYTFLSHDNYAAQEVTDLKDANGNTITDYATLAANWERLHLTPGQYYKLPGDIIMYCNSARQLQQWEGTEAEIVETRFKDYDNVTNLCYTRLGIDIKRDPEIELLDKDLDRAELQDDQYYVCIINPKQLNPTEASSWGYNMLLQDPYRFVCENTAVNLVTITGILPYGNDNKITLTPRKNQQITLKGYYRAPERYHSDIENARFYATTKKKITVDGVERDPVDATELANIVANDYNYGDWWYCTNTKEYYMIMTTHTYTNDVLTLGKTLGLFGTTQPDASVKLNGVGTNDEDSIRVRWQYRSSGAATWTDISNEVIKLSEYYVRQGGQEPFKVLFTIPDNDVLVKLTITDPQENPVNGEEYILSTNTIGLSAVSDELATTLNLDAKSFNLGQCTGMCGWEQRLVLWGVPGALNTLFVSDINNPGFFPYPNNIDVFTDPIISVHNYGNELLVLTTSALYRLTWDTEGTGWTHTLVQQNLHITEQDTYMSCVIKNMFFFKSGEYFYMMVPKVKVSTSVRGEVTIAPISKPIEKLLDNFHSEIYNLINVMVDQQSFPDFTNKLVNYFSYVDNTKVVVNYVYALDNTTAETTLQSIQNSKYLYVQLIYDTDARTWSMRAFEAAHMLYASHADAIQQDRFIDLTPVDSTDQLALQYYKFDNIKDDTVQYIDSEGEAHKVERIIKNYQYLDTGNREINTELKKRFREFQFKIKNKTLTNLGFYTSFLIDGSLRRDLQHYNPRLITDPVSNEIMLVVERELNTASMAYMYKTTRIERVLVPEHMLQDEGELTPTTLAEEQDPDRWILNQSAFPGRTLCKIRMPISGKGLTPRAIILSTNEAEYEILGHAWAYRTMHAR